METKYYPIDVYTMKCRLYPNKTQARLIDDAIYAVQLYHNCVMYDIFHNFAGTTEKENKPSKETTDKENSRYKKGDKIHFINKSLKTFFTSEYKAKLTKEHPIIDSAPAGALTTNIGLKTDIVKAFDFKNNKKPVEFRKPVYHNKAHPRRSYTYQESLNKISASPNPNVLFVNLAKIGNVKIRGWNRKIRFDSEGKTDFSVFAAEHRKDIITVTVSKDNCGDYWVCFKLTNAVYKEMTVPQDGTEVGMDVGISDIAILSDGTKYENRKYKKNQARHKRRLNRQLSRRQGWANIKFREEHKENPELKPSARYAKTLRKMSRLDRKAARKRRLYNDEISTGIVKGHNFIGVESLNVQGMFRNRHLANALSDAGMYQLLEMLKYKGKWYQRPIQEINQWTPSSKRCSACKNYLYKNLTLNIRKWKCPECGAEHDRDVNAAINILDFAIHLKQEA